jgi:hypothetical protein
MILPRVFRELYRRQPLLVWVFGLLWACALVPIWAPRFLPLLDLPNHLGAIAIWHRYHDPSWSYSRFYTLNLKPLPYWGYFFPVHLMSYLLPIEFANKIYLSAYALALPLGVALLAARLGRSVWLCLFAFPFIFNMNFMFGFITFCAGVALLPFALVALDRFLERPTRASGIAVALLSLGLYLTHVLPWMLFGVAAAFWLFCFGWHPRRMLLAAALMLPSLLLGIYGFRSSSDGSTAVKTGPPQWEAKYQKVSEAMSSVPTRLINAWWTNERAYYVLLLLGTVWLLLALSGREAQGERRRGFPYRLELLVLLSALAVFLLPMYLKKPVDLWMVGGRFVAVTAILGAILPRGPLTGRRGLLLLPVVAISIWYPLTLAKHWRRYDRRAASFRRIMRLVPRGSSTLTLIEGDTSDPDADPQAEPWLMYASYAQYYAGGFNPWTLSTGFPMVKKRGAELPSPAWKAPRTFRMDAHGIYYDYILTYGELIDYMMFGPNDSGRAPIIGHDGAWRLYRVVAP